MTVRYYSSVASEKTLTGTITSGQTTMVVSNTIGLPSLFPYTLAVDYETATEELVEVTNAAGTTLTITRAIDGTSASSHTAGARVRHVTSARDFSDSRTHENSDDGIHGLSPGEEIVGTDKVQTLTNKTVVNLQGTLLNPDVNLTGTTVTSVTRTPAANNGSSAIELINGADQTLAIQNGGNILIRNTPAMDTAVNTRRLVVSMSDGVTERLYINTSGMLVSLPRAGTTAANGGYKVIDPGDDNTRKLIQARNSADTLDKFVVYAGGGAHVTTSDNSTIGLRVKAPAAPATDIVQIVDSTDTVICKVQSDGEFHADRRVEINNLTNAAATVLDIQGNTTQTADLTDWRNGAGTIVAKIRAAGTADFTSISSNSGIFTAAAGWSIVSQLAVNKGGMVTIAIRLLRTGANIVADAFGDLASDPPIGTVAAGFRPHAGFAGEFLTWAGTTTSGTGSVVLGASTGDMAIVTFSNNGTISTGQNFHWTMSYPLDLV